MWTQLEIFDIIVIPTWKRNKMPVYEIVATRETYYEFSIEADTEEQALAEVERIELSEDVEEYAFDWYPLEVTDIQIAEEV